MPSIRDFDFNNKRVLVRCDFSVPISNNKVLDDFRIQGALETISYLKNKGAKIILLSHLGGQNFSLRPVAEKLKELLNQKVKFVDKCYGKKAKQEIQKMKAGDILLLENLRNGTGEIGNSKAFARAIAELGDVFVNEAFSVCHREHASIVGLPKLLPHFAGLTLEKEVKTLSDISISPKKPLVVIIGGSKVESKIRVVEKFLTIADHILLGGKVVNMILRVKGICVGKPWPNDKTVEIIKNLDFTNSKIHMPVDAIVSPDETGDIHIRESGPGSVRCEEELYDIGIETIQSFNSIIKTAGTIFWSGPLGLFEQEIFSRGTNMVAEAVVKNQTAFKVAGGGDTITALRKSGFLDNFSFISTGGSAMLAFLSGEKLPGIEALKS